MADDLGARPDPPGGRRRPLARAWRWSREYDGVLAGGLVALAVLLTIPLLSRAGVAWHTGGNPAAVAANGSTWADPPLPPPSTLGASSGLADASPARTAVDAANATGTRRGGSSPTATPSHAGSRAPSASPCPTKPVGTGPASACQGPTLLGPSDSNGLSSMLSQYCGQRGYGGAFPSRQPTGPGAATNNWACWDRRRPPSTIDMNNACRGAYQGSVFAKPLNPDDAFSWRCYRA